MQVTGSTARGCGDQTDANADLPAGVMNGDEIETGTRAIWPTDGGHAIAYGVHDRLLLPGARLGIAR